MKVSILLPTLFEQLADRAISYLNRTTIPHEIVVYSPRQIGGQNVVWIRENASEGLCVAQRRCFQACSGDIVMFFTDDQVLADAWLDKVLPTFLDWSSHYTKDKFILGLQAHPVAVGTCFGRYYAGFPLFWREVGDMPHPIYPWTGVSHDLGPEYLHSQWSDVALSMSVWERGGVVKRFPQQLVMRPEQLGIDPRMDIPQAASHTQDVFAKDTAAFIERFRDTLGRGWPLDARWWRAFNIDAWDKVISDNTCCVPSFYDFMQMIRIPPDTGGGAEFNGDMKWRCREHPEIVNKDRLKLPFECSAMAELTA